MRLKGILKHFGGHPFKIFKKYIIYMSFTGNNTFEMYFSKLTYFYSFFFQIFHFRVDQENRASNMFSADVLPQIFANIKSIYKFHAEFLLPQVGHFQKI